MAKENKKSNVHKSSEAAMSTAADNEHMVYTRVLAAYEDAKQKRLSYKKYGTMFVIFSGIIFLTLMFSLESKIQFLILWVITDFYCVALMIRSEYKCYQLAEILGISDEEEDDEK